MRDDKDSDMIICGQKGYWKLSEFKSQIENGHFWGHRNVVVDNANIPSV